MASHRGRCSRLAKEHAQKNSATFPWKSPNERSATMRLASASPILRLCLRTLLLWCISCFCNYPALVRIAPTAQRSTANFPPGRWYFALAVSTGPAAADYCYLHSGWCCFSVVQGTRAKMSKMMSNSVCGYVGAALQRRQCSKMMAQETECPCDCGTVL